MLPVMPSQVVALHLLPYTCRRWCAGAEMIDLPSTPPRLARRAMEVSDLEAIVAKEGLAGILLVFPPSAVMVRGRRPRPYFCHRNYLNTEVALLSPLPP